VNFGLSVIIVELWRPEVARRYNFLRNVCVYWKETTPYGKIFKTLFRKFSLRHRSTCYVQISWNLAYRKLVKSFVIYLTKKNKISSGSPDVATARIAPIICRSQPLTMYSKCYRFHINRFTVGGVIAKRVNTANMRRKLNPIIGRSLASSLINILCQKPLTNQ